MPSRTATPNAGTSARTGSSRILEFLLASYNAEVETVLNYISNSVNLEGIRATHVKESLDADIAEELGHARRLAKRIHTLGGLVPGSQELDWSQKGLQSRSDTTDVAGVIKAVIAAEEDAIAGYEAIIKEAEGKDYVTQDLAVELLGEEQEHRREFLGFLKEYQK
jgi:bacterioferritin